VLIADDEADTRWMLSVLVRGEGLDPVEALDGESALDILRRGPVDVALLDMKMPGMDGLEVLRQARRLGVEVPIIVLTGFGDVTTAVEAMKNGAFDYVTKPFDNAKLLAGIRLALRSPSPRARAEETHLPLHEIMGPSEQVQRLSVDIARVAPTDFTVIVTGETGAGKEVVARAIHGASRRAGAPFVPVDCGSIPPTLMESELFGHEKGAFTGADRARPGKLEAASGGTLFLDEISNMDLALQAKLLRALQEKQICPVGGTKERKVDIRVVAATNEDLCPLVAAGRFRRDLHHRLHEFAVRVPPLRERRADIAFLAQRFLRLTNAELHKQVEGISDAALALLRDSNWPGNVRELRNVMRRAVLLAEVEIRPEHLSFLDGPERAWAMAADLGVEPYDGLPLREAVRRAVQRVEQKVIQEVLQRTGGNKARAARILRVDYKTLHGKVKEYGIPTSTGAVTHG
jgi:two-component system nitrogen regulation response regulator GlnG